MTIFIFVNELKAPVLLLYTKALNSCINEQQKPPRIVAYYYYILYRCHFTNCSSQKKLSRNNFENKLRLRVKIS